MTRRIELEEVIGMWRTDAKILRRYGHDIFASQLDRCAADVEAAAEEWLTWLLESDAMLWSGESDRWLRSRYTAWERRGMARKRGKLREYRRCALPRRSDAGRSFAAGKAAARGKKTK